MIIVGLVLAVASGIVAAASAVAAATKHSDEPAAWLLATGMTLLLWRCATAYLLGTGAAPHQGLIHCFDAVVTPIAFAAIMVVFSLSFAGIMSDKKRLERRCRALEGQEEP